MDAQQFLAEFGHIANAPGGVAKLRELVLVLAMQGKLVPQFFVCTARELLRQVGEEKQMLVKAGVIRSPKPLPEFSRNELFCSIPETWIWVRFGEIAMHNSGKTLDSMRNSGLPRDYITTSNLYWGRFDLSSVKQMLIREEELEKCTARKNDLLICEGGEAGRAAVWTYDYDVCFQNHIHRARFFSGINPLFAYRFFEKLNATGEINAHRKGIGISNMSTKALAMIPFPLPPIEEQSRIVAKVDELMALCDTLEGQQQTRRKIQNNLRKSILQDVASAQSSHELQDAWRNLEDNFGRLFSEPEDVVDLNQATKKLALKGLLSVPVQGEMISTEIIKLTSTSYSVDSLEADWPIPEHWVWARCAWLGEARLGKMLDASKNKGELRPYLRNVNVRWHHFELTDVLHMRVEDHELPRITIRRGDLVICEGGEPGRAAIWNHDDEFVIQKALHRFRCNHNVLPDYLLLCLEHDYFSGRLARYYTGATIKHLTGKSLAEYPIPLPPISEQKRIIDAVKNLSEAYASFNIKIRNCNKYAKLFAAASIDSFTGVKTQQQDDSLVKAPQTELIAPLRLGTTPDIKTQAPLATLLSRHNGEMLAKDLWQRFGGEIDAFYAQLKTEVSHGWIQEPTVAEMREKITAPTAA